MSAQKIKDLVSLEIRDIEDNAHGWKFRPFLLPTPESASVKAPNGFVYSVWVVLRESNNGYWVIFDEEEEMFGLVTGGVVVGLYGNFMATLNAM